MQSLPYEAVQFTPEGKAENWWSSSTLEKYQKKIQCFLDKYAEYDYPGLDNKKLNSKLTISEIIGDFSGIESSAHLLEEYLKVKDTSVINKDFGYTDRQLFWIAYGHVWCTKTRKAELERRSESSPHAPTEIRVNGPLKHSKQFAKDFACAEGTEMNPKEKCSMWE
ncbi:Endothelin-converting enzyme [Nymphon striatum]|nr:Endothelin-converting enzyme [Nymphon striatum]